MSIKLRPVRDDDYAQITEIFLDEVKIPASDRLGEEGQGWSIIKSTSV